MKQAQIFVFLVSVIRSEIRWAKQVQDMLVSPVFL